MGLKRWFNRNVVNINGGSLYGDVVPNLSKPKDVLGNCEGMREAEFVHLAKSAFNLTYMSGKEKERGQGDTAATVSAFFGLPSADASNARDVLKKMAGWEGTFSPSKNLVGGILPFIKSFIGVVLQTVWNTLKLVTEVAPVAIKNGLNKAIFALWHYTIPGEFRDFRGPVKVQKGEELAAAKTTADDGSNPPILTVVSGMAILANVGRLGKYLLKAVSLLVLGIAYAAFKIWHLVGRAITSPINSMEAAFKSGEEFTNAEIDNSPGSAEKIARFIFGKIFGAIAALLSLAITAAAYLAIVTFLSPLIVAAVTPVVTSVVTGIFSPAAVVWLSGAVAFVGSIFTGVGTAVVATLGLGAVTQATGVAVVAAGAAVLAASVVTGSTMVGGLVDLAGNSVEDQKFTTDVAIKTNRLLLVNPTGTHGAPLYVVDSSKVLGSVAALALEVNNPPQRIEPVVVSPPSL